ncbi:MAG: DUF2804 domain-containing protein [Anaerovoracaceae bacterium]|jgi:hypothetical protein
MEGYRAYISSERRPKETPADLVDESGIAVFGTFDREFETMDLVRCKGPTHLPDVFNKQKLTLWEAVEVDFGDGVLLAGGTDMGLFGMMVHVFFDRNDGVIYKWSSVLPTADVSIAPNLLNGSVTYVRGDDGFIKFENDFGRGACEIEGVHIGEAGSVKPEKDFESQLRKEERNALGFGAEGRDTIEYELSLRQISPPSVVSIPFGKNRPLYTEKSFFNVTGSLRVNGKVYTAGENTTAIIDDHRGFYPRRMHYDWMTAFGKCAREDEPDERRYFALNLTANQSIDPYKYNEDLIWIAGGQSLLPPVTFERDRETKELARELKSGAVWRVSDDHDMVDVRFEVRGVAPTVLHAGLVNIDYFIVFGEAYGYVRDEEGRRYILDGIQAIGEDKSMLY